MAIIVVESCTYVKYHGCITKVLPNIFPYKIEIDNYPCIIQLWQSHEYL